MEKDYLYWAIGLSITLFVLFITFWLVWYKDRSERYITYRKRFFDANGIKPSKKYIKDINRFLDIIYVILHNHYNKITESQSIELEDLYKKIFIKGVNTIYKLNYAIDISEGFKKRYIDEVMKEIRSEYKSWQKFNNTKEIY